MERSYAGAPVAMGAMRLSTERPRDEAQAVATLHAAFDAGVTLVDTADAYAWDDSERGHNERLVARALASWTGDGARVRVATKGGLVRPQGRWVPDGRGRHLKVAAEASRRALGVEQIDLYQLHAPDPATPLATSLRALFALQREGVVKDIGLCNVTLSQLREARALGPLASVQVELSPWCEDALRNGVAEFCANEGILLLAYRPLGGREGQGRLQRDPVLREVAARRGSTPAQVVLAWLRSLDPVIAPLPGPTRPETGRAAAPAVLEADDLGELDRRFPAARLLRVPRAARRPPADAPGDVVLVMGLPGAGKSTLAAELVGQGYARLNRDEAGGRLRDLLPALARTLAGGQTRVVLDNTYGSRAARNAVLETAWAQGVPARVAWLQTSLEDAQVNVVQRMLARHGRLLSAEELQKAARKDPGVFPPRALYHQRRDLEPPELEEGFTRVDVVPFERRHPPGRTARALLLWYDDLLWKSRAGARSPLSPDDLELRPGVGEALRRYRSEGWLVRGLSWQPEVAAGQRTEAEVEALFAAAHARLGLEAEGVFCPHGAGPASCWCRKPLPGLGVLLVERHRLHAPACILAGDDAGDEGFARALGFQYRPAAEL